MTTVTSAKELEKVLNDEISKVIVEVSQTVTEELIIETPRDTGWAKANWIPAIGGPGPSSNRSKATPSEVSASRRRQRGAINGLELFKLQTSATIYITNSLPYINRLNNGYSLQAPTAFVQQSITSGLKKVGS